MPAVEKHFQLKMRKQTEAACQLAALLSLFLFPLFSFIDYFTYPSHLYELNVIRYIAVACFLVIYLIIRKKVRFFSPYLWAYLILGIGALSITCMTLALEGYKSPYYAGVNLVILGAGLLLPWSAKRMAAIVGWMCVLYFLPVLIQAHFQIDDPRVFINNGAFLLATAVISVSSANLSDKLRRDSFVQLMGKNTATHELEMREEFISIASHELKTPITVLKLQNDLFMRNLDLTSDPGLKAHAPLFTRYFLKANNQLRGLQRLIEDMLDVSRINSGKLEFCKEAVELNEVIVNLFDQLREKLAESKITLHLDLQEHVNGNLDPVRLDQVLTNLVTNAIRYAPNSPLYFTLREKDHVATIHLQDQGPGIPPAFHEKIFERFSRVQSNYKIAGLGLGLYIAKQIVLGMKGTLELEKSQLGAHFKLTLPLS